MEASQKLLVKGGIELQISLDQKIKLKKQLDVIVGQQY